MRKAPSRKGIETKCVSLCDATIHKYGFIGAIQNEAQNQRDLCLVLCRLEGVLYNFEVEMIRIDMGIPGSMTREETLRRKKYSARVL